MKRLFIILLIAIGIYSCENFDIEHPDFDYTSGYFPYQYPVRTLVLGDYIYDNENDNNHKFIISAAIGGVYENRQDRVFDIEVDESLCQNVLFDNGDTVRALPSNYYTLSDNSKIVVPSGKINGGIEVQLTDAFFADTLSYRNAYVVPIRMKQSADVDTILNGLPAVENPDVRVAGDWITTPKNFTMFAVKYINEFHGTYFQYGESKIQDVTGAVIESNEYSEKYVEQNNTVKLVTSGRNQVLFNTHFMSGILEGNLNMNLNFNGENCTIEAANGSEYAITGNGVFKSKAYNWGNKDRDGIELNYTVTVGDSSYVASDVLVIRDRAVGLETYTPEVYE